MFIKIKLVKILLGIALTLLANIAFSCPSLKDEMDRYYGAGMWQYRSTAGTGTDISPAVHTALNRDRLLCIDKGSWALKTPLNTSILSGATIRGVNSQASVIYYQSTNGAAFWYSGSGGKTGGGLSGLAILLDDGYGNSNAYAILLQGDAQYQPDQMEFRDLYVTATGNSYWYSAFYANGIARISPQGIRVVTASNIQLFRSHHVGAWISNGVQWTLTNFGVYVGLASGSNMYIAGGGTPATNTIQIYGTGLVAGQLNVTNTSRFDLSGVFGTFATDTSAKRLNAELHGT